MTIGRKMDQAWKDAIARGLKASGKISHAAKGAANAGGRVSATNIGTRMAVKGAGVLGKAVGTGIGAAKGLSYGVKSMQGKNGYMAAHPIGGTASALKTSIKTGAKLGGFGYKVKSQVGVIRAADKIGIRSTLRKGLQFKR